MTASTQHYRTVWGCLALLLSAALVVGYGSLFLSFPNRNNIVLSFSIHGSPSLEKG